MKFIKFGIGGLFNFLFKVWVTMLLSFATDIFYINYLITQVIVLFESYLWHSKLTFHKKLNFKDFSKFFKAVILLKIADYTIANLGVYVFKQNYLVGVTISSAIIIFFRFLLFDKYVFKSERKKDAKTNNVVLTAATVSGNKGAEAMLTSTIQNTDFSKYSLLSYYYERDLKENKNKNLIILNGKPLYMLIWVFPLSIIYFFLKLFYLPTKIVEKNKEINAIANSDYSIDVAGISFVDGREIYLPYNFLCLIIPLLMGKKVIKLSQALGPFNNFLNKTLSKIMLPRLELISARGKKTHKHLLSLNLKNVILSTDLAFSEKMEDYEKAKDVFDKFKFTKKIIGISTSSVVRKYCKKIGKDYESITSDFTNYLIASGYNVILIPHSIRLESKKNKNNDIIVTRKIYEDITDKEKCLAIDEDLNSQELRYLIGKCDLFIASRFHAMISSLSMRVPTLVLGWSHKYREILSFFKLEDYCIDFSDYSVENFIPKFEDFVKDEDEIRKKLSENLSTVKKSSKKQFDMIKSLSES